MPAHRDTSFVQYRPRVEPLKNIEGFLASQRFAHRGKLDQLGIETDLINLGPVYLIQLLYQIY